MFRQAVTWIRDVGAGLWAARRFARENARLGPKGRPRVVFFGDSITSHWNVSQVVEWAECINRGIGGQTTRQMRMRFRRDALSTAADVVVILGGTNDVHAGIAPDDIAANLLAMAAAARCRSVRVLVGTVPPNTREHRAAIEAVNRGLVGCDLIDYHAALSDGTGVVRRELSADGAHPNLAGYEAMRGAARRALERVEHQK